MALTNYSDLLSAVAGWLNRTDLTSRIPDFITLAESRLNRELRLRVMEEETPLTITAGNRTVALPTGFLEPIALWSTDTPYRRQLIYLSPVQMDVDTSAGEIYYWTITGSNIEVDRPTSPTLSMIMRYLKSFALTEAAPTNWLMTNHPDAYLFATLVEAAPYLRDDKLLAIWLARANQALSEINAKESRSRSLTILNTGLSYMPTDRRMYETGGYGTFG